MAQISSFIDPALAFLDSAKDFDTVVLARSTEKALQIIMPWCHLKDPSKLVVAKEMHEQALVYARAIDSSVSAAHLGFTMAEDALTLVEMIPKTDEQDRREYLEGVKDITQKGYLRAMEAKKASTEDVNESVEYGEVSNGFFNVIRRPFSEAHPELSRGIHDLEEFSHILSKFAAWWNEIAMETNTQLSRGEMVMKNLKFEKLDKLRMLSIESKWKDHRKRYAAYVDEIGNVQDRYPKLFNEAKLLDGPTYTQSPLTLETESQADDFFLREKPTSTKASKGSSSFSHQPEDPPKYTDRPALPRSGSCKVIISEDLSKSSYMSASLSNVQVLEKNKCLLILQLQCHPSSHRRFTSLRIKWRFRSPWTSGRDRSPSLVDVAPKQSIGAKIEEVKHRKFGVNIPVQFSFAGANVGPQFEHQWGTQKAIQRATVLMGSVRGHNQDSAEWSVEENASAMSGIPPHFCVAVVVDYEDTFMMELDIVAKQSGIGSWLSSRNHARSEWLPVDVERLQSEFPEYKPAGNWQEWFPQISGEVAGGYVLLPQDAVRR
ncbi:hypothetical protein CPB84DRAFT_1784619 [Gymnopilus junonius]|uniref:Uncharacterized protein n=1 Tax=Gymnopilus junonius TaxID=109634 RepID=A0A9P5TK55_GYMJU|nr:hypothetical protein CPB84DRAFT_1784619 [Gymnopilus junonius]